MGRCGGECGEREEGGGRKGGRGGVWGETGKEGGGGCGGGGGGWRGVPMEEERRWVGGGVGGVGVGGGGGRRGGRGGLVLVVAGLGSVSVSGRRRGGRQRVGCWASCWGGGGFFCWFFGVGGWRGGWGGTSARGVVSGCVWGVGTSGLEGGFGGGGGLGWGGRGGGGGGGGGCFRVAWGVGARWVFCVVLFGEGGSSASCTRLTCPGGGGAGFRGNQRGVVPISRCVGFGGSFGVLRFLFLCLVGFGVLVPRCRGV